MWDLWTLTSLWSNLLRKKKDETFKTNNVSKWSEINKDYTSSWTTSWWKEEGKMVYWQDSWWYIPKTQATPEWYSDTPISKPNKIISSTSEASLSTVEPTTTDTNIDTKSWDWLHKDITEWKVKDTWLTDWVVEWVWGTTTDQAQITWKTWYEDTNWDWTISADELSWDYKTFYDQLSPIDQKQFLAIWQNAMDKNLDIAEAYANYMRDYNTTKTRAQEDEDYRLKIEGISEEMAQIQESQSIRRAQQSLDNLKQSIYYLWNMWMPWQSAQRMVSLENQINEAEKTTYEVKRLVQLAQSAREADKYKKAEEYERQVEDLTTKLNDDIDKSIQDAYNTLVNADNNGKLDTVEELTAFRNKLYFDLDRSITWFTDASIEQMQFLSWEVNNAIKEAKEYQTNSMVINRDMSELSWYYVDWNGNKIIWSDWVAIPYQIAAPLEPVFDKDKWILYTFSLDENWGITTSVNQVTDENNFTAQTIDSYVNLLQKGKIDIDDVPWYIRDNPTFIQSYAKQYQDTTSQYTWDYSTLSFANNQNLINKYPNEASFKNNNPAWITWQSMSSNLRRLFDDAWIQYSKWTPRPTEEWWNYVLFNSVQDGIDGYMIALTQAWNQNIKNRLATWVWTMDTEANQRYAEEVMSYAWIPSDQDIRFEDLNEDQLSSLVAAQMQRESPNYYNELVNLSEQPVWIQISPIEEQVFKTADSMTWNQKVNYLKDEWLYDKYLNYQVQKKEQFGWVYAEDVAFDITSILPRDLYRTDADFERVIRKVENSMSKLQEQWIELTPENIANDIRWWNINEWVNQVLAEDLKKVLTRNNTETDRIQWTTVANLLNEWKDVEADRYIRNMVDDFVKTDLWTDAIDTTTINQILEDNNILNNLIAKNPDKIGAFDWRVNDFMRKFKDYPEMQQLNTLLTMNQADIRKYFAWSAVTDSEMSALVDYIGWNIKMTPNNLLTMLNTIKDRTENLYIKQREKYWYTPKATITETWEFAEERWRWTSNISSESSDEEILNYLNE